MQNPLFPDLTTLKTPISLENPIGINLRENHSADSPYQKIKTLRAQCRAQERHAIDAENNDALLKDWAVIVELATNLLRESSKDIEVTAWLIEGLTRVYGFAGLHHGFEIAYALIESFWPTLYPLPDEEGSQTTLAPLTGLNGERNTGTLITPINSIALIEYNGSPLASWHYLQNPSSEIFQEAAVATGWEKILLQKNNIQQCLENFEKLCILLDEKCGREHSPPNSNIRNALKSALDFITILQQFAPPPVSAKSENSSNTALPTINTHRQKAFDDLKIIAAYFRQHEPNSPVPLLLEQAIRWGNMSLPELLSELVSDEPTLAQSYKLIGVHSVANS